MRPLQGVIGWLPLVLLTACIAAHTGERTAVRSSPPTSAPERPAPDRLLTRGDIQVAEAHLQDFGLDPGPVDGMFTVQTQAAVRAYQARYGLPVSGLLDYATRLQLIPGLDYDRPDR
jgi:peptidoglycan hydrolase-like protein with peptidoglycan-binding domain